MSRPMRHYILSHNITLRDNLGTDNELANRLPVFLHSLYDLGISFKRKALIRYNRLFFSPINLHICCWILCRSCDFVKLEICHSFHCRLYLSPLYVQESRSTWTRDRYYETRFAYIETMYVKWNEIFLATMSQLRKLLATMLQLPDLIKYFYNVTQHRINTPT